MKLLGLLFLALAVMVSSCGDGRDLPAHGGLGGSITPTTPPSGPGAPAVAATVTLTATPSNLTVLGTSSLSATVLDTGGANMPDGTIVTFALSSSVMGTINAQANTSGGIATATFTAASTPGTVTVTAASGSASNTASITITAPASGSITFDSAAPAVVGIRGTGQAETSLITFAVKDINGNPVVNGIGIDLCLFGPSGGRLPQDGGEYIAQIENLTEAFTDANSNGCYDTGETFTDSNSSGTYDSPIHAAVSTVNGEAKVFLNSGTVPGPVIITATVTGTAFAAATTTISIGGGVPNDRHLSLATDTINLEGLGWFNVQANISVFMADRYGNFNVLEDTSVSFDAESGAIDRSSTTDATGSTTVVFRTQLPYPKDVALIGGASCTGAPTSVNNAVSSAFDTEWERCLLDYVNTTYGIVTSLHPRDGWAKITARTRGEEAFDDTDGNGIYDVGVDPFTDTPHEAFVDFNDDDSHTDGTGIDPFEVYEDDNASGSYDVANTTWDPDKTIFEDITLLITGSPEYIRVNPAFHVIGNGGSQTFTLLISDINLNSPIGGTTVSIATKKGEISGTSSFTYPDEFRRGPIELTFVVTDTNITETDPAEGNVIDVKVTYRGTEYPRIFFGTVD